MAARRESGLTWTSVTSTSNSRGSSNSKPMISYSSSFTASETRNMRRTSIKNYIWPPMNTDKTKRAYPRSSAAHHDFFLLDPLDGGFYQRRTHQSRSLFLDAADRKSTRLNSSHLGISYAVFC